MKAIFRRILKNGMLSLVLGPAIAMGQSSPVPKPEPPPGPLLATAPDHSEWLVTFSYPDERSKDAAADSAAAGRTKTIVTSRAKDTVHEEITDASGGRFDEWFIGGILYSKNAAGKTWGELHAGDPKRPAFSPLPASGFRGLDWINKESYAGTMKFGGRMCLVFIDNAPPHVILSEVAEQPGGFENFSKVAFVDAESRLPVQEEVAGIIRSYKFVDPSPDAFTLPPDLDAALKQEAETRAALSQRLPRPY